MQSRREAASSYCELMRFTFLCAIVGSPPQLGHPVEAPSHCIVHFSPSLAAPLPLRSSPTFVR
eukprot:2279001-Amphidinium_carterae.1